MSTPPRPAHNHPVHGSLRAGLGACHACDLERVEEARNLTAGLLATRERFRREIREATTDAEIDAVVTSAGLYFVGDLGVSPSSSSGSATG